MEAISIQVCKASEQLTQGIGTTHARHRNDLFKASERTERAQKERLFLRPDGSKRPEVERRPPHPTGTPPDSGGEKITLSAEGNQLAGTFESLIDVRTDILFAEEFVEVRLVEHSLDSGIDTR